MSRAGRQEAQRLGRILRPKPRLDAEYNAFFYSICSKDTAEMYYSAKRQEFLLEQGYSFRILADLVSPDDATLCLADRESQRTLLARVMAAGSREGALEKVVGDDGEVLEGRARRAALLGIQPKARRSTTSSSALAGGTGRYSEQTRVNPLFQRRRRELERDRKRLGY